MSQVVAFIINDSLTFDGISVSGILAKIVNVTVTNTDIDGYKTGEKSNAFRVAYTYHLKVLNNTNVLDTKTGRINITLRDLAENLYDMVLADAKSNYNSTTDVSS